MGLFRKKPKKDVLSQDSVNFPQNPQLNPQNQGFYPQWSQVQAALDAGQRMSQQFQQSQQVPQQSPQQVPHQSWEQWQQQSQQYPQYPQNPQYQYPQNPQYQQPQQYPQGWMQQEQYPQFPQQNPQPEPVGKKGSGVGVKILVGIVLVSFVIMVVAFVIFIKSKTG
jgi:hypothetical protein